MIAHQYVKRTATQKQSRSKTSGTSQTNRRSNAPNEEPHTKKPSHNASGHSFVSQQPPHEATPPLHTQQLHKSRTQMKITCSAWSSCPFVLHTMRGTHDKVTCSRHTRKEQPFGLQPGTREAKCKAPTHHVQTHLWCSLIPKSHQIPQEEKRMADECMDDNRHLVEHP